MIGIHFIVKQGGNWAQSSEKFSFCTWLLVLLNEMFDCESIDNKSLVSEQQLTLNSFVEWKLIAFISW